ncbi:putative IS3-family transposase [Octadecabacter antarcticus 307]|uniref:Putative IS3-family transposase n=1 Tax=Octadecabacter antarcticus 307 TaxID=391626 RepID=M9RHK7_9RHOB|nr:putative IS3-family transposase [Octadecabacter antarcticus 307]
MNAVMQRGTSIALACHTFQISETCYWYSPILSDENEEIADWLERLAVPDAPNDTWSIAARQLIDLQSMRGDFMADQLADGRSIRTLNVLDDFSRENLVLVADTSLSGQHVARELDRVIAERGKPQTIRVDNVLCAE